jgi:hypothetical protein
VLNWADAMIQELDQSRGNGGHIGIVRAYLKGDHPVPYMPDDAEGEFNSLARQAITNYMPLISGGFSQRLFVDGYRTGRSADNADGWQRWRDNKLASRQKITMRGAIEYGVSYVAVEGKKIRTLDPRKSWAWYENDEDEYPLAGLAYIGDRISDDGAFLARYEFWHKGEVITYERTTGRSAGTPDDPANPRDGLDILIGQLQEVGRRRHGKDYVPWIRFRDRLDDEAVGVIRPLIPLQDRINASVFYLLMALHYASFRQRWATGLIIPRDTQETLPDGTPNPNFGKPIEPFKAAVNRLWVSESPDTHFGDFQQTSVDGHLAAIENAVRTLITIGQASPLLASGNSISNVAVESVAAFNESMNSQLSDYQTLFGEQWEAVLREAGAGDKEARIKWRDTEPRSFAQVVDGLVKLGQMGAPAEGLFEMVPGITDTQLEEWRALAARPTETDRLAEAIARQTAPAVPGAVPPRVANPFGPAVE